MRRILILLLIIVVGCSSKINQYKKNFKNDNYLKAIGTSKDKNLAYKKALSKLANQIICSINTQEVNQITYKNAQRNEKSLKKIRIESFIKDIPGLDSYYEKKSNKYKCLLVADKSKLISQYLIRTQNILNDYILGIGKLESSITDCNFSKMLLGLSNIKSKKSIIYDNLNILNGLGYDVKSINNRIVKIETENNIEKKLKTIIEITNNINLVLDKKYYSLSNDRNMHLKAVSMLNNKILNLRNVPIRVEVNKAINMRTNQKEYIIDKKGIELDIKNFLPTRNKGILNVFVDVKQIDKKIKKISDFRKIDKVTLNYIKIYKNKDCIQNNSDNSNFILLDNSLNFLVQKECFKIKDFLKILKHRNREFIDPTKQNKFVNILNDKILKLIKQSEYHIITRKEVKKLEDVNVLKQNKIKLGEKWEICFDETNNKTYLFRLENRKINFIEKEKKFIKNNPVNFRLVKKI